MLIDDRYLGDGVYASFDGFCVILDLRAQDDTTRIALEDTVCHALREFIDDAWHAVAKSRKAAPDAT